MSYTPTLGEYVMQYLFGMLFFVAGVMAHPLLIVVFIIGLGYLVWRSERHIRQLLSQGKIHMRRLWLEYVVQYAVLYTFIAMLVAIAYTYVFFTGMLGSRMSTDPATLATYRQIFTEVFPFAEQCSSSGSLDASCSPAAIKMNIKRIVTDDMTGIHRPRFVRWAADDRIELLEVDTGKYYSIDAHDDHALMAIRDYIGGKTESYANYDPSDYFASYPLLDHLKGITADDGFVTPYPGSYNLYQDRLNVARIINVNGQSVGGISETTWREEGTTFIEAPLYAFVSPLFLFIISPMMIYSLAYPSEYSSPAPFAEIFSYIGIPWLIFVLGTTIYISFRRQIARKYRSHHTAHST